MSASARGGSRKKITEEQKCCYFVPQKIKFSLRDKEVLLRKTILSDSGRSRPPPKPPAVLVGSGGFAPRTPFDHRAPKRLGVYSAKQQFTRLTSFRVIHFRHGECHAMLAAALRQTTIYLIKQYAPLRRFMQPQRGISLNLRSFQHHSARRY